MRTTPPIDSSTVTPASAVPVTAADCSLASMTSLPATLEIVGTLGAAVSIVMTRVDAADSLPAASETRADRVSSPCPMSVKSSDVRV